MGAFACTITVDIGKMTSSQSNFAWLATEDNFPTAAIDGGLTSINNGGGNLRCYTDSTKATPLPIDIVSFVTGGTPSVQVWGLSPTLGVGGTVYIEADTIAITQPAVGAAFGRNAVWVDCAVVSHDTISDSTGGATVAVTGAITPEVGVFGNVGGGGRNDNASDYVTFTDISVSSEWTIMAWVDTQWGNSRFACLGQIGSTGNQANLGLDGSGNAYYSRNGTDAVSANTYNGGSSYEFFAARESSALNNLLWIGDGTDSTTTTYDSSFPTLDRARIFKSADDTPFGTDDNIISEVRVFTIGLTDDHLESIYSNQSDPATFWTTGAWEEQGGAPSFKLHHITNYSGVI